MQYSAEDIIDTIGSWDQASRSEFQRLISVNLTLSIKVIGENNEMNDEEKLGEIKWVNEFHHRLHSWVPKQIENKEKDEFAGRLFGLLKYYSEKMEKKGAVEFPVISAFETVQKSLAGGE